MTAPLLSLEGVSKTFHVRPVLGAVPQFGNLFINSGHGTLGWTLGAGSAAAVADMVCGSAPQLDLSPFSIKRF